MKRPIGSGGVYERGSPGFDKKILATSFNRKDPGHRPKVFIEANDIVDVINAVKRARRENLKISIVSGGHSWSQNHLREGGLLLSMARFNKIHVDPDNKTAVAGPGCWGLDVNRALKKHKLFFPVAHAPDVCLGGFLLQGGFGWDSLQLGNACESVLGIDVVLADGSLVHANENENSDLYWAARGAGTGFFGVIVRYHLKLHKLRNFYGLKMQIFKMKYMEDICEWADRIGPEIPRSVEFQFTMTPKAFGIFSPGLELLAPVITDSYKDAKEALSFMTNSPLAKKAALNLPLVPMSTGHMSQIANLTKFPETARWCADNMWMGDAPVEDFMPQLRKIRDTMPPPPSHALWLNWRAREHRPDMAFGLTTGRYIAAYGEWENDADTPKYDSWATDRMKDLEPFGVGSQLADENLGKRPTRFTTDEKMAKLDVIRAKYDPDDLFHTWAGRFIPPADSAEKPAEKKVVKKKVISG